MMITVVARAAEPDAGWGRIVGLVVAAGLFGIGVWLHQMWQDRVAALADEDDQGDDEPDRPRWADAATAWLIDTIWHRDDPHPLPSPTVGQGHDPDDPEATPGSDPDDPTPSTRVPVVVYRTGRPMLGPPKHRRAALEQWVAEQLAARQLGHNEIVRQGADLHRLSESTVKRAIRDARRRVNRMPAQPTAGRRHRPAGTPA